MKLRKVTIDDIDFLYKLRIEYEYDMTPKYEAHRNFVLQYLDNNEIHNYLAWYVIVHLDKRIGVIPIKKNYEFGYQLLKEYQGKGLIHEAFELLFNIHPQKTLWARSKPDNKRSHGLLKKWGFVLTDYEFH